MRKPLAGLALGWLLACPAFAGGLSPQEERGKQIYFEGTSPRGEAIAAFVGAGATRLPGAAATCASCHGPDGRGRPEAGVIPSDIRWDHLLKPYGHAHVMGRRHPAFDDASLRLAIRAGRDPAGNKLDAAMPTYAMSDADVDDLFAYMRRLATDFDPGLSEDRLRIGTVLPVDGRLAEIGRGVREVLSAFFDDVNRRGGIYGRRLELVEPAAGAADRSPLADAEALIAEGDVFAVLSPVVVGAESGVGVLAEDERVPVIGPLTLLSPDPFQLSDFTFHLFSGLTDQARILVDFAARELELTGPGMAVLAPEGDRYRGVLDAIEEQLAANGWATEVATPDASASARQLAEAGIDVLFYLGAGELAALLEEGERIGWRPRVLLPGAFASQELLALPASLRDRVYLSYPTLPSDRTPAGASELQTLLAGAGFPERHRTSQVSALAAAKVLVAGLQGAGRDLSREKLLRALEKLYGLETGLTPPITYGTSRRVGALGAYVVAIDLERRTFAPAGGWRTPRSP